MPALLWVAFWSSIMGAATCWGETRRPARATTNERPESRD